MNKSIANFIFLMLMLTMLTSCKEDDIDPKDEAINTLTANAWAHAKVSHADGDLSEEYKDFVIQFSRKGTDDFDGVFIISGGSYAFHEIAGQWKLDDSLRKITLSSGKEIDVSMTNTYLIMEFETSNPGGRIAGLSGSFRFQLRPL